MKAVANVVGECRFVMLLARKTVIEVGIKLSAAGTGKMFGGRQNRKAKLAL